VKHTPQYLRGRGHDDRFRKNVPVTNSAGVKPLRLFSRCFLTLGLLTYIGTNGSTIEWFVYNLMRKECFLIYCVNETYCKVKASQFLHIHYIDVMGFVKIAFIVVSAVVLQALQSVSQLTREHENSINRTSRYYSVDIMSSGVHVSEMKQVNICVTVILI